MAQKSSRQYMAELNDIILSGATSDNKRANKIFDILADRGFDPSEVSSKIQFGDGELPDKYKRGGSVSRKRGGKIMQGYKAGGKV